MRQELFEIKNRPIWDEYQNILDRLEKKSGKDTVKSNRFPRLYRNICNHYATALSRQYSPALVSRLHNMTLQGHKKLYRQEAFDIRALIFFVTHTFPATFRLNIGYFVIALLLFLLPSFVSGIACYKNPDVIYTIMDERQVANFEYMYDPANKKIGRSEGRSADTDIMMFGFYIKNNISIGFRTFAGGILAGVGTVFFLVYNGIVLGGVSGHVTQLKFTSTFWPFVCGHGAFELTAIIISGMAGLILARAVVAPGNYTRSDALKKNAPTALIIMLGASIMLLIAAFIEAFWSSTGFHFTVKYPVAAVLWGFVIVYLGFAGRRKAIYPE